MSISVFIIFSLLLALICWSIAFYLLDKRIKACCFLATILFTLPLVLFFGVIGGIIKNGMQTESEPYVVHEIVGLSDNFQISGNIGIHSGRINEKLCYTYGYKTASGGMKIQNVDCNIAEVFISDDAKPRAEWFNRRGGFWFVHGDSFPICKIYLPTGSVIEDYVIDFN